MRYGPASSQSVEWLAATRPSRPVLLVAIHGGYWRARYGLEELRPLCAAFSQRGFPVASLEYRRLGEAGGGWPGTLDDVESALAALPVAATEAGLQLSGALLVGHSAGGHLALWAAARAKAGSVGNLPLVGVVGLAPVSDLVEASRLHLSTGVVYQLLGQPAASPGAVPGSLPSGVAAAGGAHRPGPRNGRRRRPLRPEYSLPGACPGGRRRGAVGDA